MQILGVEKSSELRKHTGWFLVLGIVLMGLGILALIFPVIGTGAAVVALGIILLLGGVVEIVYSMRRRGEDDFLLRLLAGILAVVVGFFLMRNPFASAFALTLLIAAFLIVEGLFRIVTALSVRFYNWGWVLVHGLVSLFLGILILGQWPLTGLWAIGVFIGIDLIFNGWTLIVLSLLARRQLPASAT